MSQQNRLRETVDRMVEDAIRRILPNVLNEVLLRTIVGSGVIAEAARPPVAAKPNARPSQVRSRKAVRPDLSQILDEGAGAEFYAQAEPRREDPVDEVREVPPMRERIRSLPPELQAMAEGLDLSEDDDGGSWDEEPIAPRGDDAGHLDTSAKRIGVDFARMRTLTQLTEQKKPKVSAEDARANAQFEAQRLKMMRERLNGGKPVG